MAESLTLMTFYSLLPFASSFLCGSLAIFVLLRDVRSFAHRAFALGMITLAVEQAITGMSTRAVLPEEVFGWQHRRLLATAFIPGSWLLFSLSFGRANYEEFVGKWKWVALATFAFPLILVTFLADSFFTGATLLGESGGWLFPVGWSGYVFYLFFLLGAVVILVNLEGTLRAFTGSMRWQIKFMVLGVGALFATRIYTSSQTILISAANRALEVVDSGALVVAAVLIIVSLTRLRILNMDLYLSQTFLYNSVTVVVVGLYLLAVGSLTKVVNYLGGSHALALDAFIVFLALLGLVLVLLSDKLRQKVKGFVSRNFHRPQYDYRREWTKFTQRTTSVLDLKDLSTSVAGMVSETFGVPSVTIWLLDETEQGGVLLGSTIFSASQQTNLKATAKLIRAMRDQHTPVDFDRSELDWVRDFKQAHQHFLSGGQVRYYVPLVAGQQVLGVMTLGDRLTKESFSVEDFDLLKTIADQAAANLLNLKLSQQLLQAKEMESFQTLSAFFIHDLKNLASRLSLTMGNLANHFDNPAFRKNALHVISQSVEWINALCSGLSLANKKLELERTEADLNELVSAILIELNGSIRAPLVMDLHPVPNLLMDQEQIQKVLVNLLLNANDAVGDGGQIEVTTEQRNGWIVVSVSDSGCGMTKEFIAHSLFRPFQTTKKQGLGIGLFHSKKIVESHHGRIEVESEEGRGTTVRVMLPVG